MRLQLILPTGWVAGGSGPGDKDRQGQVGNRPADVVVDISLNRERGVPGTWAGTGGEGTKQWIDYLTELRNCGAEAVSIVCWPGHWSG